MGSFIAPIMIFFLIWFTNWALKRKVSTKNYLVGVFVVMELIFFMDGVLDGNLMPDGFGFSVCLAFAIACVCSIIHYYRRNIAK